MGADRESEEDVGMSEKFEQLTSEEHQLYVAEELEWSDSKVLRCAHRLEKMGSIQIEKKRRCLTLAPTKDLWGKEGEIPKIELPEELIGLCEVE